MQRRALRYGRRGSSLLEFAIVLPFFLLFIVFTFNMSALFLQHGTLQHATNVAARAGAQAGGASPAIGDSLGRFDATVDTLPGLDGARARVLSGRVCRLNGNDAYVTIEATYDAPLAIPGMDILMRLAGSDAAVDRVWTLTTRAVSRCEVVR